MANNASNIDTMISKLGGILEQFPGAVNQTHCFVHIISILAKAILRQFDIPQKVYGNVLDKMAQALADLAKELDLEERAEQETQEMGDSEVDDQPLDTWVDFCEGLTEEQVMALDANVQPMRSMLVKVEFDYPDPNLTLIDLLPSCASLPLLSRTPPQYSFQLGTTLSPPSNFLIG